MDYMQMYKRGIESDRQKLQAYIKRHGFRENLGQPEQRDFNERVSVNTHLSYQQQAELRVEYILMLDSLEL
jgi:hypothetical protein